MSTGLVSTDIAPPGPAVPGNRPPLLPAPNTLRTNGRFAKQVPDTTFVPTLTSSISDGTVIVASLEKSTVTRLPILTSTGSMPSRNSPLHPPFAPMSAVATTVPPGTSRRVPVRDPHPTTPDRPTKGSLKLRNITGTFLLSR